MKEKKTAHAMATFFSAVEPGGITEKMSFFQNTCNQLALPLKLPRDERNSNMEWRVASGCLVNSSNQDAHETYPV
jgi:hypothetical protein